MIWKYLEEYLSFRNTITSDVIEFIASFEHLLDSSMSNGAGHSINV